MRGNSSAFVVFLFFDSCSFVVWDSWDGIRVGVWVWDDGRGCILVGENKVKGQVVNSTATFKRLYELMKVEKEITIEIA
jgi:hypothetical protein